MHALIRRSQFLPCLLFPCCRLDCGFPLCSSSYLPFGFLHSALDSRAPSRGNHHGIIEHHHELSTEVPGLLTIETCDCLTHHLCCDFLCCLPDRLLIITFLIKRYLQLHPASVFVTERSDHIMDAASATSWDDFASRSIVRMDQQEESIASTGRAVQALVTQVSELTQQLQQLRSPAVPPTPPV